MAPELLQHQTEGISFLKSNPRAALYDEPGLGKSAQMLLAAKEPILVLAPAMVLDSGTWDDEHEKWAPGADLTQASYSKLCVREERGRIRRDHEGFPIVDVRLEYRRRWGTVLCDESHYLKGRKTSWTAGVFKLQEWTDRLDLATGTPIPNWAHEAFTSLQLMYPEEAGRGKRFGSYWRWAKEWFVVGPTMWSPMDVGDLKEDHTWEEFRAANWGDRMRLRLRDDCLDLPPLTITQWRCPMTAAQKRIYKQLKKDYITWLDSGTEIASWSSAGQSVKLAKAATGLELLERGAGESGKLGVLESVLADRPRPTLVVGHFQDTAHACARSSERAGRTAEVITGNTSSSERRRIIRRFQSGALDVLCATILVISEGMTLHQGGADQVIRVERSALPSKNEQVIRRLHRLGVERPIQVIDLVTPDTVDERMLTLLQAKTDHQVKALGIDELRALA